MTGQQLVLTNTDHAALRSALRDAALAGAPPLYLFTGEGEPLVVLRESHYQKLLDQLDFEDSCRAIREGIAQIDAGLGRPLAEVAAELEARFHFQKSPESL